VAIWGRPLDFQVLRHRDAGLFGQGAWKRRQCFRKTQFEKKRSQPQGQTAFKRSMLGNEALKAYSSELMHDTRGELINILGSSRLLSLIGARIIRMDPAGCRIKRRAAAERIRIADGSLAGFHRESAVAARFEITVPERGLERTAKERHICADVDAETVNARILMEGRRFRGIRVIFRRQRILPSRRCSSHRGYRRTRRQAELHRLRAGHG